MIFIVVQFPRRIYCFSHSDILCALEKKELNCPVWYIAASPICLYQTFFQQHSLNLWYHLSTVFPWHLNCSSAFCKIRFCVGCVCAWERERQGGRKRESEREWEIGGEREKTRERRGKVFYYSRKKLFYYIIFLVLGRNWFVKKSSYFYMHVHPSFFCVYKWTIMLWG